ncbi:SbcC/MukB-like Walker B domain-containing protein [Bacillus sp. DJP31]|uniref:SbcC/MukB-like Walker B domain-containing protein n=1 Tax=Bacillus sp. DJP31 TaxID=3409789 RepID=UPI003BB77102
MKPILLSIAGLHSFREKQEVDFETLCEGGVFGIFGPTGSGKSSILDAMTLALYGKVERAANQTQGIMNHAEDVLSVSFTFELLSASGIKHYTVERSFKRTDDIRLKTASCRLIEKAEETTVLADKSGEVNQKIQELLGLTIEDFTRAVVLPQGKFAEFLSLKGVDRRQMLQRIFHLEQYGDDLSKKVKARLQEANQKISELHAEQAGLGDASKEALQAAIQEVNDLDILLNKRKIELEQTEQNFEKEKQLWVWQQEKVELSKKLKELELQQEKKVELSNQLALSEEAERLLPYAEELQETEKRNRDVKQNLTSLQESLINKRSEYERVQNQFEEATKKRTKDEPGLLGQKEKLIGAKELSVKKFDLLEEVKQHKQELSLKHEEIKQKQHFFTENKNLFESWVIGQKELKIQLSELSISVEDREQLQKARDEKQHLSYLKQQLEEVRELYTNRYLQQEKAKERVDQLIKQEDHLHDRLKTSFQQLEDLYEQTCERERNLETEKQAIELQIEDLRKRIDVNRELKLAEHLASRLVVGEPCQVCGSIDHNGAIALHVESNENLELHEKQLNAHLIEIQNAIPKVFSIKLSLEQLSEILVSEGVINSTLANKLNQNRVVSDSFKGDIQALLTEIKALTQDVIQQKEQIQKDLKNKKDSTPILVEQKQSFKYLEEEVYLQKGKMEFLEKDLNEAQITWVNRYPTYDLEAFDQFVNIMATKDKEAQTLAARIEKSVPLLEDKDLELAKVKEEITMLEKGQIERTTNVQNKEERLQELTAQLQLLTSDEDVDLLLQRVEKTLESLHHLEKETSHSFQIVSQQLQSLEGEVKATEKALVETAELLKKVRVKWDSLVLESTLQDLSSIKKAIIPGEKRKEMKEEIQLFSDKLKQTQHDFKKVIDQIGDTEITEEKWLSTQELFTELKQQLQDVIGQVGAAARTLELLKDKHIRFTEIEKEREELGKKAEQYGKLQQVLKGNSFVEFLAEEQLVRVARDASERLALLTRQRYAIEVDSQGGFIMRDDANGGVRRPVSTLSGGETFLTSLALALALSAQIQLRGEYPLQFFFLDEGFGTLDTDLLDTVVTALEKLHTNNLSVGVISHVNELRLRLPKKLIVDPAEPSGRGTRIKLEVL